MGHPARRHRSRLDVRTGTYCLRLLLIQFVLGNTFTVISLIVPTHHPITLPVIATPPIPTVPPMKRPTSPRSTAQSALLRLRQGNNMIVVQKFFFLDCCYCYFCFTFDVPHHVQSIMQFYLALYISFFKNRTVLGGTLIPQKSFCATLVFKCTRFRYLPSLAPLRLIRYLSDEVVPFCSLSSTTSMCEPIRA